LVVIYLLTGVDSIAGGCWLSSAMITRGMQVLNARKLICALCIFPIVFAAQVKGLLAATLLVALAASTHRAWAANMFSLPSDTMARSAVCSVAGFRGMVGALVGMGIAQPAGYVLQTAGSYVTLSGAYVLAPAADTAAGAAGSPGGAA
jgi:ACS family hexuronate transporter-like MFS transporter